MHFFIPTVIAVLPFLAAASPVVPRPKGVSIPIAKRSTPNNSGVVDAAKLRAHLAHVQAKYDHTLNRFEANTGRAHPLDTFRGSKAAKRATGADPLTDANEELWFGSVSMGTPSVKFTVDFDSGSSDLFVPDASCTSCGSHTTYDPSHSSTSHRVGKTFELNYGDGSKTSGEQYTDTVTVAGLTANSQTLGSATSYSSSFQKLPSDGLMGLAFPSLSAYGASPFFNTLISNGAVDAGVFSFYLASSGSELFLGGSDSSKYSGSITWNSVTQEAYWQINMDSINVGGSAVVSSLPAIIDSGTSFIIGDPDRVAQFYSAVPGSKDASSTVGQGYYTFPCNSPPTVSVTFNGVAYDISANNFNLGTTSDGSNECVGAVTANNNNQDFWIMGDAFMKNVYSVFDFDNSRVGFATL